MNICDLFFFFLKKQKPLQKFAETVNMSGLNFGEMSNAVQKYLDNDTFPVFFFSPHVGFEVKQLSDLKFAGCSHLY